MNTPVNRVRIVSCDRPLGVKSRKNIRSHSLCSASTLMSLSYLSKQAVTTVIKHGIDFAELPVHLVKECANMEDLVKTELTGNFTYQFPTFSSELKIDWNKGEWKLTPLNLRTISIRAGRREDLGLPGGELFLFKGSKISIEDLKIDIEASKVFFYGKSSSRKTSEHGEFKCTLEFFKGNYVDWMMMISEVVGETGKMEVRIMKFTSTSTPGYNITNLQYDSDTSVDYED